MAKVLGIALAALAFAPAAAAKGPLVVCGVTACVPFAAEGDVTTVAETPPAAPAPFFVIRFADLPNPPLGYYVPGPAARFRGLSSGVASWWTLGADTVTALGTATAALAPFAAPTSTGVLVDGRSARDGGSYLRLFAVGRPTSVWPRGIRWLPIVLLGGQTPWTDGADTLAVSRRGGYLLRYGQVLRISPRLARRIRRRQPLRP